MPPLAVLREQGKKFSYRLKDERGKRPRLCHKHVSHRGAKTGSDIVLPEKKRNPWKEGEQWTWEIKLQRTEFLLAAVLFDMSDWGRRPRRRLSLDHRRQGRFGTGRLPPDDKSAVRSLALCHMHGLSLGLTCGP